MPLPESAQRVQAALAAAGFDNAVVEMPASTATAADAAAACGCTVAQIAKSLIFRGAESDCAYLIIASGTNRVNERAVGQLLGEPLARADADFVRAATGFAIGGVPPLGHPAKLTTLVDRDLMAHDVIWAAAGTPRAVFQLTPDVLARLAGGRVVDVT